MKEVIVVVVMLAVLAGAGFGIWVLQRKLHYEFAYEAFVQQTVCETVKPEYVVPGRCK